MPTGGFYTGAQPISGGFLKDIFGSKPVVPEVEELSLPEEQLKAIDANIAAAPGAAKLAGLSQEQLRNMMRFAIPGFDSMVSLASGNISDALKGLIPYDVSVAARTGSAGRAVAGGFASGTPGSMGSNLEARDLGLTSLARQQYGQSALQGWLGAMEQLYAPSQAIYSSSFITPMQQYATHREESNLQFGRQWLVNQIAAMPDPTVRGIYDTVLELVNSYLGGTHQSYQKPNYGGPNLNSSELAGAGGGWGSKGEGTAMGSGLAAGFAF